MGHLNDKSFVDADHENEDDPEGNVNDMEFD